MHNPDKHLGEKIRLLRKQQGITQKDLAGDKITRNMLSLIESGNASPSVSTLLYIAKRLNIPAGYFFTDNREEEIKFLKMSAIQPLREAFLRGDHAACQRIGEPLLLTAEDDEIAFILAASYLGSALAAAECYELEKARLDLAKAKGLGESSIYCRGDFTRALSFYDVLFTTVCSDDIADVLCDLSYSSQYVPFSLIQYFISLRLLRAGEELPYDLPKNSFGEKHLRALSYVMEERYSEGLRRLRELSSDPDLPYYMQYRVLSDLEKAAGDTGDIRLAYSASQRKIELIAKCRIHTL